MQNVITASSLIKATDIKGSESNNLFCSTLTKSEHRPLDFVGGVWFLMRLSGGEPARF